MGPNISQSTSPLKRLGCNSNHSSSSDRFSGLKAVKLKSLVNVEKYKSLGRTWMDRKRGRLGSTAVSHGHLQS